MGGQDRGSELVGTNGRAARLAAAAGRNVLVVGPPMSGKRAFGLSVLAAAASSGRDVLVVTTSRSVTSLPFDPNEAGRFGVVDCTPGSGEDERAVVNVASPGDLTGISMPVSRFLDGATEPVVLLDSVSSMLQYAAEESAFRFLSVLTSSVADGRGVGLYTFDEGVHTERTHRTFSQLFDGRVELREADDGTEIRVDGIDGVGSGWGRLD
jgi:KaiC/GvpD/RAD55 family RecA-like ATPase